MSQRKPLTGVIIRQIIDLYKINEKDYAEIEKINKKIEELNSEIDTLKNAQQNHYNNINFLEERVKQVANGYTSKELIKRVDIPVFNDDGSPALTKSGKPRFKSVYQLIYPETVFPPKEETIETSSIDYTPGNTNEEFDNIDNNF